MREVRFSNSRFANVLKIGIPEPPWLGGSEKSNLSMEFCCIPPVIAGMNFDDTISSKRFKASSMFGMVCIY